MKRVIALVFVLTFALFSCGKTADVDPVEPSDYAIEVIYDEFDENGCHVILGYPELKGTSDDSLLNKMLYDFVYGYYKKNCLVSENGEPEFDYKTTDFKITYSVKGFFSALVFVEYYSVDSTHSMREAFSINCSVDEEKIYSSSELISDYEGLRKQFVKGSFIQEYGEKNIESAISLEELISQYLPEYNILPEIYFEDGKLGINIDVVHVYGGYVGFTVDIGKVKDYLNKEIGFVASICGK